MFTFVGLTGTGENRNSTPQNKIHGKGQTNEAPCCIRLTRNDDATGGNKWNEDYFVSAKKFNPGKTKKCSRVGKSGFRSGFIRIAALRMSVKLIVWMHAAELSGVWLMTTADTQMSIENDHSLLGESREDTDLWGNIIILKTDPGRFSGEGRRLSSDGGADRTTFSPHLASTHPTLVLDNINSI